jgi:hypothetical protein
MIPSKTTTKMTEFSVHTKSHTHDGFCAHKIKKQGFYDCQRARRETLKYSEVVLDPPVCGKTKIAEHLGEINTKINTTMNTLGFEYPSDFFGQNHFLPHVTIMMVSRVNFLAQQSHIIICSKSDPKP